MSQSSASPDIIEPTVWLTAYAEDVARALMWLRWMRCCGDSEPQRDSCC